jgi:hypothetical protein
VYLFVEQPKKRDLPKSPAKRLDKSRPIGSHSIPNCGSLLVGANGFGPSFRFTGAWLRVGRSDRHGEDFHALPKRDRSSGAVHSAASGFEIFRSKAEVATRI